MNMMNIEKIDIIIKNLESYKKQEDVIFDDITKCSFENFYNTLNNEKISNFVDEIVDNMSIISKIHDDNIHIISERRDKYISTSLNVQEKFMDLR